MKETSRTKRIASLLMAIFLMVGIMPVSGVYASAEPAAEETAQVASVLPEEVAADVTEAAEEIAEPAEDVTEAAEEIAEPAEEVTEAVEVSGEMSEETETSETAATSEEPAAAEETSAEPVADASEEPEAEEEEELVSFDQSARLDDIIVTVRAPEGVFPAGAELSVSWADKKEAKAIEDEIAEGQEDFDKVYASYTIDVKITLNGEEIQPNTAYGEATVQFAMLTLDEDIPVIHNVSVYHTPASETIVPEQLDAEVEDDRIEDMIENDEDITDCSVPVFDGASEEDAIETVTVTTDGFSPFTLQYHCVAVKLGDSYEAYFSYDYNFSMSLSTMASLIEKKCGDKTIFPVAESLRVVTKCISSKSIHIESGVHQVDEDEKHVGANCYILPVAPFEGTETISFELGGVAVQVEVTCSRKIQFKTLTGSETVLGSSDTLTVYSFPENVDTLTYTGDSTSATPTPGLTIAQYSAVIIVIGEDKVLNVTGGNGSENADVVNGSPSGGAAGIRLPVEAILFLVGDGEVDIKGGDGVAASAGADGGDGGNGTVGSTTYFYGGFGGMGGHGGSGAGAGIGGGGGYGGAGGEQANYSGKAVLSSSYTTLTTNYGTSSSVVARKRDVLTANNSGTNGNDGYEGGDGESMGTLFLLGSLTGSIQAGTTPVSHASEGEGGENDLYRASSLIPSKRYYYAASGGGGGGGGGAGTNTYSIGGGGAGGGGGASGGSGGTAVRDGLVTYPITHGSVGGGGSSALRIFGLLNTQGTGLGFAYPGLDNQTDDSFAPVGILGGLHGTAAANGWNGGNGLLFIGLHSKIRQDDPQDDPEEPDPTPNEIAYIFDFVTGAEEDASITPAAEDSIRFYIGEGKPHDVTALTKTEYDGTTFAGYYTEPNGAGDHYYNEYGTYIGPSCTGSDYPEKYETTLYAYWIPATDGVCYTILDGGKRLYFPTLALGVSYAKKNSSVTGGIRCDIYLCKADIHETVTVEANTFLALHTEGCTVSNSAERNTTTNLIPDVSYSNGTTPTLGSGLMNIASGAVVVMDGSGTLSNVGQRGRAAIVNDGTLTLTNVTVNAQSTQSGDGIAVVNLGTLTVNTGATLSGTDADGSIGGMGIYTSTGFVKTSGDVYGSDNGIAQCGASLVVSGGRLTGNTGYGLLNTAGDAVVQGSSYITGYTNAIRTTGTGTTSVAFGYSKTGTISGGEKTGLTNESLYYVDRNTDALTKVSGGYYGTFVYPANLAEGCQCYTCTELGLAIPSDEYGSYPYVVAGQGTLTLTAVNAVYDGKTHTGYDAETLAGYTVSASYEKLNGTEYVAVNGTPVEAGTYRVTVRMSRTSGTAVSVLEGTVTFEITPLAVYVTPHEGQSKFYGEADPTFVYDAYTRYADGEGVSRTAPFALCRATDTCTFTLGRAAGETPGKYNYTMTVSTDGNYTVTLEAQDQFRILKNKAEIVPPMALELTYNGTAQDLVEAAEVVGSDPASPYGDIYYFCVPKGVDPDTADATWVANPWVPDATAAGEYTVYWRFKGNPTKYFEDYPSDGGWKTLDVTIDKALAQIDTEPVGLEKVQIYGTAQELITPGTGSYPYSAVDGTTAVMYYRVSAEKRDAQLNTYTVYLDPETKGWVRDEEPGANYFSTDIPTMTNAGQYTIEYYVKGSDNYYDSNYDPATGEYTAYPSVTAEIILNGHVLLYLSATAIYGDALDSSNVTGYNKDTYELSWGSETRYCDFVGVMSLKAMLNPLDPDSTLKAQEVNIPTTGKQRELTVSWENATTSFVYDGESHCPVPETGNYAFDEHPEVEVTGAATEIGTYTATVTQVLDSHYKLPAEGLTCEFTIEPSAEDITAADTCFTYGDGLEHVIEMVNVPVGSAVTYRLESTYNATTKQTVNETLGDYGTHPNCTGIQYNTVVYTVGYSVTTPAGTHKTGTAKVTVNGLDEITFVPQTARNLTYNGTAQTLVTAATLTVAQRGSEAAYAGKPTVTGTSVLYAVSSKNLPVNPVENAAAYGTELPTAVNAGTVYVSCVGKVDYSDGTSVYTKVNVTKTVIAPKPVTVLWTELEFTYDGTSHVPTATLAEDQLCAADTLNLTVKGAATDGGTHTAIAVSDNSNYTVANPNQDFVINKANPGDFTAPTALELVYNEQDQTLVEAGHSDTNEIAYSTDGHTWSTDLPAKKAKGTYTVYYKLLENSGYLGTEPESLEVTIQSKLLYDIAHAADGDIVPVIYNESFDEPVEVYRSITIDLMGKELDSRGTAMFYIPAAEIDGETPCVVELRDTLGGGHVSGNSGTAIQVAGTLRISSDAFTADGTTVIETLAGGDALIDGGFYTGALVTAEGSSLKVKYGFFDREVVDPNLYYRASSRTEIKMVGKCVANADATTAAAYPYRVTCSGITLANVTVGHGTTICYYVYLDRPTANFTMQITRENTGSGTPWTEYPAFNADTYTYKDAQLYYAEFHGVNPQCMTNNVEATLFVDGVQVDYNDNFSVQEYCEKLKASANRNSELNDALADMLEYGTAAQYIKNYSLDDLADEGSYKDQYTEYVQGHQYINDYSKKLYVNDSSYNVKGFVMYLADQVTIRFRLLATIQDSVDVYVNDQLAELIPDATNSKYVDAESPKLGLQDLGRVVEVKVYDKETGQLLSTCTISLGYFVQEKAPKLAETQRVAAQRYYNYALSALEYAN